MITLLSILALGFFLGMRHATDADHVVAITTIVSQKRSVRGAALTGLFWGVGHSITILMAGGVIVFFGLIVPERLELSLELCVALMLIALGALNLKSMFRFAESRCCHAHFRAHDASPETWLEDIRRYRGLRPLGVGVVHGLAGSAAVTLLVLPVITNAAWAVAYLLVFGAGTIIGMMLITAAIALPFTFAAERSRIMQRCLGATTGLASISFGCFLVYQIGFVNGLFTG